MEEELKQLKSVLRSLVVSSPTQVDVRSLFRDYRNMIGCQIPVAKFGYKDPVTFFKERLDDCFLFQGPSNNPILTLIVPDTLKHIDNFVQRQKVSSAVKIKGKRRSVPESIVKPVETDLIVKSFVNKNKPIEKTVKPPVNTVKNTTQNTASVNCVYDKPPVETSPIKHKEAAINENGPCSSNAVQNFLKKRMPMYNSLQYYESETNITDHDSKGDDDSGRRTGSSTSSSKRMQLEELKKEIKDLILEKPEGVWCTDLLGLYRKRYGRELNFIRFGYTSILSLACAIDGVAVSRPSLAADWRLADARAPPPPPVPRPRLPLPAPLPPTDPDDALPGIDFEPDVFPADCVHFLHSVAGACLAAVRAGDMLEVAVAEVYSPSHFWLLRLGESHNIAMEDMMDEMNAYYIHGEGRDRRLAVGAVRVGHYCASLYDGDWHRSLIVRILDSDTVKVRHIDYGTVERCNTGTLKPLLRKWAQLEAQAVRARLAGARPPAAGRRWPRAAAHHFLRTVRDRRLVANVVAVDPADDALEVLLIDTAGEDDVSVSAELVRAGHADPRPDSAVGTSECYLYPRFEALEAGATPNFAEIHAYLRDGIALECVEDYRRHVPPALPDPPAPRDPPAPSDEPDTPDSPEPAPPPLINRIPLLCPTPPDTPEEKKVTAPLPPPPPKPCARLAPRCSRPPAPPLPPPPPVPRLSMPAPYPPPVYPYAPQFYPAYPFPVAPSIPNLAFIPNPMEPMHPFATPTVNPRPVVGGVPPGPRGLGSLPPAELETFAVLSRVDSAAAYRFMVEAVTRALAAPDCGPRRASALNPDAAEFRMVTAETQTESNGALNASRGSTSELRATIRPPPGFEK